MPLWTQPIQAPNLDERELIALARHAVTAEVLGQKPPKVSSHSVQYPVFITLEVNGTVRGCRGDLLAQTQSIEDEVVKEARAACKHDPRYRPITRAELKKFLVTVTVVNREQPTNDVSALTPEQGLVVRNGSHVGIVLPWEGKDPATRLKWAYKKAGLPESSLAQISILFAQRFRG